ncbi:MAG: LamG-like jellyroll fold domain-containing protein [Planctomycetia bacterium]
MADFAHTPDRYLASTHTCANKRLDMNHSFSFKNFLLASLLCVAAGESRVVAQTPGFRYTLPRAGRVSLAIYDGQGRQVRTLLAGEAQSAGEHSLGWDGLDRLGRAMPGGSYEWRLLLNEGLEADYLAVVGQSPINAAEPWVWTVGSHQGPSSVVVGADGAVYHGSRNSEGPPVLMKLGSENGPVLWTRGWQSKGPVDMLELGAHLYVLGWNCELQRVDATTGRDDGKPVDLLWPGDKRTGCDDPVSSYGVKLGVDGESLVVAYREHGVLRWIAPTTGAVLREVAVPRPKSVVAGEKGTVFVLSGNALSAVAADGAISTIIGEGVLTAPVTFDFDRASREFFIVEGGADQRVRRFAFDGKSLRDFGRPGGRVDGRYVAADFRDVSHLRCDGAGGFYAVESDHLRRIVHVNAKGAVVKEWLGGSPFFSVASVDAATPAEIWYQASYTTMAVAALDLESGTVRVTHTYSMPEKGFADGLFPAIGDFPVWRARRHAGGTYLIHESPAALLRVDAAGGKLVPVALASHKRWDAAQFQNAAINAAMEKAGLTYDDVGSDAFTWSDANGNGEFDAEEFRFHVSAPLMHGRYCAFDEQLNVYVGFSGAQNYVYTGKRWLLFDFKDSVYAKLPNVAAVGAATPVWDWSKLELSRAKLPDDLRGTEVGAVAARCDAHGGVTLAVRGEIGALTDRHGLVWPEDTIGKACLLRALPDGTAWTVSKQKSPGMTAAAVMSHPGYFPGVAHGCIIASNRNHYGATAWTEDGLYAGFFLDRHANDLPDWAYEPAGRGLSGLFAGDDWECAGSLAELADGSVLWIPRSSGRAAVFRVRGWDQWFRASGKIAITQAPPAAVLDGVGLAATYFRGQEFEGPPVVDRVDARLWFTSGAGDKRVATWAAGPCEGITAAEPFSVRWTGHVVAPLSEVFWFRVYNQTADASFIQAQWWKAGAGSTRVWLNDVLIIDDARFESAPVRLIAGRSYNLKIEYASPGLAKPEFAFSWCSNTKEWNRVPTVNLHAGAVPDGPAVHVAAEKTAARFTLGAPQQMPLTVRFRHTGTDAATSTGQVTIPAATLTASVAVAVENGPREIALEPSADYRGDGTAGAVVVGSVPSVTDGLAVAYLLDEAQGRTVHDSVGGAHASFEVFMNPPKPRWQATGGVRGGAMSFFEPGTSIGLPGAKIAGDFSMTCWLRTKQATQPVMQGAFDLRLAEGRPSVDFSGWSMAASDGPRLDDDQWHHLAFCWDQSGGKRAMHLYIDGRHAATGNGPAQGGADRLLLGVSNHLQGQSFIGSFDEIRIYKRPLSAQEIFAVAQRITR